jgi:non-ribosomal peptide synthase protein (TIGR01720 family)
VRFNYLGQFDRELDNALFAFSPQSTGPEADPGNAMTARLEVLVMVVSGRMNLQIHYNHRAHRESSIGWFRDAFLHHVGRILEQARTDHGGYVTAPDFSTVDLNDEDLATLFK